MDTESARPVVMVSASIGAGHDSAATELGRRLGGIVRRHDFLDLLPRGWGKSINFTYAQQLAHAPQSWGRLLDAVGTPAAVGRVARLCRAASGSRLSARITPDVAAVISTYPLASQALGRMRLAGLLHAPVIAVMTDPSVHPLCLFPGVDLHLAQNEPAAARIRELGLPAAANAPLVDPRFRPAISHEDVLAARRSLGLPVAERLAVVVAGSWGVGDIGETVNDLLGATDAIPVVVCGRNERLRRALAATGQVIALGWVADMPSLLRAADVVVHNAGGLTSLEAMASGVPVISYRCLPGHGVANADVLDRAGLSAWPRSSADLWAALADPGLRERQRHAFQELLQAPAAEELVRRVAGLPVPAIEIGRPVAAPTTEVTR